MMYLTLAFLEFLVPVLLVAAAPPAPAPSEPKGEGLHELRRAVNVALGRPCHPAPLCSTLLDGDTNASESSGLRKSRRSLEGSPNGTYLQAGEAKQPPLEAFSSASASAQPVYVFLEKARRVQQVVITCGHSVQATKGDFRRKLLILVWAKGAYLESSAAADLGPPDKRWTWDPQKLSGHALESRIHVVVRLDHEASVVAVRWAGDDRDGLQSALWITEVAILSSVASPEPEVQHSERRAASTPVLPAGSLVMGWHLPQPSPTRMPVRPAPETPKAFGTPQISEASASPGVALPSAHSTAVARASGKSKNASGDGPSIFGDHIEASAFLGKDSALPDSLGNVDSLDSLQDTPVLSFYFAGMPLLAWVGLLAAAAMCVPRLCAKPSKYCQASDSWSFLLCFPFGWHTEVPYTYEPVPEAESEALLAATNGEGHRTSEHMNNEEASYTDSPEASRPPSPAPCECSRSETEPEGEPSEAEAADEPAMPSERRQHTSNGRLQLLYASPLCYRDPVRGVTPLPQIPFEQEWDIMVQAYDEAASSLRGGPCRGHSDERLWMPSASFSAQPLTAGSLQRALAPAAGPASLLHLSAHGVRDCLVLEDGCSTAHFFSCELLEGVLELGISPSLRLVLLNACSLRAAGVQLVKAGVPHVICADAELQDSASHVFLCTFYSNLFQGSTVGRAFNAGLVALRSHSERAAQVAADVFCLLPEGPHDEVLFPPKLLPPRPSRMGKSPAFWEGCPMHEVKAEAEGSESSSAGASGSSGPLPRSDTDEVSSEGDTSTTAIQTPPSRAPRSERSKNAGQGWRRLRTTGQRPMNQRKHLLATGTEAHVSPFRQTVPAMPEDFLGRALDVWSLLQHLSHRRVVVVCAAPGEDFGCGKSAVLDAVHRAFALQAGGFAVSVALRSLHSVSCAGAWIEKIRAAVRVALGECQDTLLASRSGRRPGRTAKAMTTSRRSSFHMPHNDPRGPLEELIEELLALADVCEARSKDWPHCNGRILLLLDEADHLCQQQHFQEAVANILQRCPSCSIMMSTHQAMVGTAGGRFKVVTHKISGLGARESARLFLRRAPRPLRWGELRQLPSSASSPSCRGGSSDFVFLNKANEGEVLDLLASQLSLAAQRGNPRRIIELASNLGNSLLSLSSSAGGLQCPASDNEGEILGR